MLALFLASGCHNVTGPPGLPPRSSLAVYPDTDIGFGAFINELLDAHARSSSVQRLMHSLVIPNSSEWFIETFGPTVGPIFDFRYRHQLRWQFGRLSEYLPRYRRDRNFQVLWDHSDGGHLSPMVGESQLISLADRPLKIYVAVVSNGDWSRRIGYFVYVDGSFRLFGYFDIDANAEQLHSEYDNPFED
jgi:hypothetical protein